MPDSLDGPDAADVLGMSAVSRAAELDRVPYPDLAWTPPGLLAWLRATTYSDRRAFVVEHDGSVVGVSTVSLPRSSERTAWVDVVVDPGHRRRGIGRALLEAVEAVAAEEGRTTLIGGSQHGGEPASDDPAALEPPTGSGRVRATDAGVLFARAHGYALEQAERYSVLDLPVPAPLVDRLGADAAARAGDEYRLHTWTDRTPDHWLDQYADLCTRMSTDVPTADLDIEEDPWDGARIRTVEDEIAAAGRGYLTVVAEHLPTGRLAAFTMVEYPHAAPEVVYQEDTLVLADHRGRRLGMLVKAELVRRLAADRPAARRLHTWNAEENGHMLAINVALGFHPQGVEALWQKRTGG